MLPYSNPASLSSRAISRDQDEERFAECPRRNRSSLLPKLSWRLLKHDRNELVKVCTSNVDGLAFREDPFGLENIDEDPVRADVTTIDDVRRG